MATLDEVKFLFDQADKSSQRIQSAMEDASTARVKQTASLGRLGLAIGPDGSVTRAAQNPFLDAEVERARAIGGVANQLQLQQERARAEQTFDIEGEQSEERAKRDRKKFDDETDQYMDRISKYTENTLKLDEEFNERRQALLDDQALSDEERKQKVEEERLAYEKKKASSKADLDRMREEYALRTKETLYGRKADLDSRERQRQREEGAKDYAAQKQSELDVAEGSQARIEEMQKRAREFGLELDEEFYERQSALDARKHTDQLARQVETATSLGDVQTLQIIARASAESKIAIAKHGAMIDKQTQVTEQERVRMKKEYAVALDQLNEIDDPTQRAAQAAILDNFLSDHPRDHLGRGPMQQSIYAASDYESRETRRKLEDESTALQVRGGLASERAMADQQAKSVINQIVAPELGGDDLFDAINANNQPDEDIEQIFNLLSGNLDAMLEEAESAGGVLARKRAKAILNKTIKRALDVETKHGDDLNPFTIDDDNVREAANRLKEALKNVE